MTINEQKLEVFVNHAVADLAAGYNGVMVSLGNKLGLYRALAGAGPLSSHEVANRSGTTERYVREWLNSQVAGGYIAYHVTSKTYELTPEQAAVLADEDSSVFIPNAWEVPASMWFDEQKSIRAFRTGEGVPWGDHHERLFCGVAAFFRNSYKASLVQEWLPALDGVVPQLKQGIAVADVGCGHGHSTIMMAEAFPNSRFRGFDVHAESIDAARAYAVEAGVADRVEFQIADARSYDGPDYDLICFFDCLHDLGDPVGAAAHAGDHLTDDGVLMLIEPYARDRVEDNLTPVGRLYYAGSTTLCCAHSLSEDVGLALGAQAGEAQLAEVLNRGGFSRVRLAHETPFNLILEARP